MTEMIITLRVMEDNKPEPFTVGQITDMIEKASQPGLDITVGEIRRADAPRKVYVLFDEGPIAVLESHFLSEEYRKVVGSFLDEAVEMPVINDLKEIKRQRALAKLTAEDRELLGIKE